MTAAPMLNRQKKKVELQSNVHQGAIDFHRIKGLLPEGSRLTRYGGSPLIQIGDATFDFEYRRDTFEFKLEKSKLPFIGIPELHDETFHKVFLTNSGQAAINAVYFYLDKILGIHEIESHNDYLYVGAYRLQDLYKIKHTKNTSRALWICSTATRFENAIKLEGRWDVVIVDTTCWAVGSPELQLIYEKFKDQAHVIFFRSHSKLDMGGVEYGSLGNLTVFSNDEVTLQMASLEFRKILGLSGGYAILDEIPPYLFTAIFFELSKKRCALLVENTKAMETQLQQRCAAGEFIFPDHYKYFFLRLNLDTTQEFIATAVKKLNFLLGLYVPESRSCASFGFNFPSVTFYNSDEGIGHFFRFSTGTIDNVKLGLLARTIREVFPRE